MWGYRWRKDLWFISHLQAISIAVAFCYLEVQVNIPEAKPQKISLLMSNLSFVILWL